MPLQRKCFIYRVEGEQRLTLSIKTEGQGWKFDQLRGVCNARPSEKDLQLVQSWLEQQAI